jgi:ATP-dependent DNA ligase
MTLTAVWIKQSGQITCSDDLGEWGRQRHDALMGLEGIVSKRLGSKYRSGRSPDWLKFKNPAAPAVSREAEEDWGR